MVIRREEERDRDRIDAVLQILRKQSPLTIKQEKYCNDACVERFLKAKGDNVKKAAKQLRACLSWRDAIGAEHLMADEFSAELSEGIAYLAGHDDEVRPVLVFRIKQDYQKFHSQKFYVRLLVFTLEVAIGCMPRFVDQFVLIFDAISSSDYSDDVIYSSSSSFAAYPRAASLRFEPRPWRTPTSASAAASTRFSFTVSHHFDSLKPWYLSTTAGGVDADAGPALVSPANARSLSFASPLARSVPSTPCPRTPRPTFLKSPAAYFKRERRSRQESEKERGTFGMYVRVYRRPYDEVRYRSMMRPPLGGLASIVSHPIRRRYVIAPQRF
ncbi:hypothetical protein QJS10_CPA10g00250 [Acorus calamus]|uniref:CRAL-TRIO domain-containing protein n=1 Tax=Acorus calamus TaxID=4465 RepID=A0AAV9DXY0_ACOCL|nr:hypothetical protein QJS10_CPA10g00250 [Acorus calamus]